MSEKPLIQVETISKKFCLHLKRSLWYGVRDLGRELMGQPRSTQLRRDEFWAIRDVSFQVKRGEILGIIGPNGSGKTTLLRLINGLLMPDMGRITIRGRVGALIQLGAGFSPIMSGLENIRVNAAVLGISSHRINQKIDDIINFADIGDFIHSPVRSYSSGMRARLGFAVAIHMDPDILLVDEVLAVGDMVFRNKALDRMHQLANSGVAVVFISHNLSQVDRLCQTAIYLKKGLFCFQGSTSEAISNYASDNLPISSGFVHHPGTEESILVKRVTLVDTEGNPKKSVISGESLSIELEFEAIKQLKNPLFLYMLEPAGRSIIAAYLNQSRHPSERPSFSPGRHVIQTHVPLFPLLSGRYQLRMSLTSDNNSGLLGKVSNLMDIQVDAHDRQIMVTNTEGGVIELPSQWQTLQA